MTDAKSEIYCFGEVLWDCLPEGLFLGGAPVNVAYHLHRLGQHSVPLSAVGDDFLGEEVQRRISTWGMDSCGISVHAQLPTGAVVATLDASGNASYDIREEVAWDEIPVSIEGKPVAIVFGSLAQRATANRETLDLLLAGNEQAMKVFDVNFRPPFDDEARTWELASCSTLVKLNHDEAAQLAAGPADAYEQNGRIISERSGAAIVCITAGAAGAGLLVNGAWHWEPALPVEVADTVGAGDSFLAALITGLLKEDEAVPVTLQRACRLAEFIASRRGAQPDYDAARFA
ncbi:MAG: carbohydrate kinase [Verrucomicrobiota bacterium]